ncbi:hypothetical protein N7527_009063 [Penicillium freii]|nr:hypothetical protein N7527_009063 [Penicillium freii]
MLGFISVFGNMAKWIRWLLHNSCYDSAFGERRRIFGASREDPRGPRRSGPKVGVVTTSISRDTSAFSKSYRRGSVGIGSFQDGGLKYNFAGEIANQVSLQIWPTAMGSTRMLSLGTGKAPSNKQTPHFRHVFHNSFKKWRGRLNDSVKGDTHRLDVSLGNAPHAIDAVEAMEDYRDLVILQVGSGRMARDTATTLLVSRFFFVVDSLPEDTATAFWCRGSVRCKGPARIVILALENLYPDGLSYVSDCGLIDKFCGLDSLCPSYRCYSRSISLLARHLEYTRIGGFLECMASFISRQGLRSSFGQDNYRYPYRQPCQSCDITRSPVRGRRRKRESRGSEDIYPRKWVLTPDPYRNSRVKFLKRSQTLKAKAYKLTKFCDTDIYLFVNHQRESFVYNSEQQYPNLERLNFSKIESLPESSESNLSQLTRYFVTRLEHFRLLEDLYRRIDPTNILADKEAL